jgi:hypothetical protein
MIKSKNDKITRFCSLRRAQTEMASYAYLKTLSPIKYARSDD